MDCLLRVCVDAGLVQTVGCAQIFVSIFTAPGAAGQGKKEEEGTGAVAAMLWLIRLGYPGFRQLFCGGCKRELKAYRRWRITAVEVLICINEL